MAQRVLVTAGGSGIGREIARAFVDSGAKVCVCDIDEAALKAAAKDIPSLITKVCDVSKRQDIEHMVADSVDSLGGLDVLVNNAGISGPTAPVAEIELGPYGIRANAILPGAVGGARIEKVFEGRAQATHKPLDEVRKEAMAAQSIKRFVDPKDIAALAVFLASDAAKSISGQMLPIDNDMQMTGG
jgi:NAD(P)-dependent dehydrogenase (short-subunit alcohol dehydrogenase family)